MLYIDPEHCIDCEACVPECPVEAIHHETRMPAQWSAFVELNRLRSAELKALGGPITEKQAPLRANGCKNR